MHPKRCALQIPLETRPATLDALDPLIKGVACVTPLARGRNPRPPHPQIPAETRAATLAALTAFFARGNVAVTDPAAAHADGNPQTPNPQPYILYI